MTKKAIGIDIGSLTTKAVAMEDGRVLATALVPSADEAETSARAAFEEVLKKAGLADPDEKYIVTTGLNSKEITFKD
jgi:activator of 2-hydroxyglutaryl-CoA dehydratase